MVTLRVSRGFDTSYIVLANPADADLDMDGFDITDADDYIFRQAGQEIRSDTDAIELRLPTGDALEVVINSVLEYVFTNLEFSLEGNDINNLDDITFSDGHTLTSSAAGLVWNVGLNDAFNIQGGATDIMTMNNLLVSISENLDMLGDIDMNNNYITNLTDGIVRIGNSSSLARARLRGFYTASPANPPANETDIIVVDNGVSPVFRVRYNDAGVMKVGDLALV